MDTAARARDLLLAYDDDFTGFGSAPTPWPPVGALGGTSDPDGYYEDFAAKLGRLPRTGGARAAHGSPWPALVLGLRDDAGGINEFVVEATGAAGGGIGAYVVAGGARQDNLAAEDLGECAWCTGATAAPRPCGCSTGGRGSDRDAWREDVRRDDAWRDDAWRDDAWRDDAWRDDEWPESDSDSEYETRVGGEMDETVSESDTYESFQVNLAVSNPPSILGFVADK